MNERKRQLMCVLKKELLEIKRQSLMFILFIIALSASGMMVAYEGGSTGVFSPEANILISLVFGGLLSATLIKDSMSKEKHHQTLPLLYFSKIPLSLVIFAKISVVVLIASIFQISQGVVSYLILDGRFDYLFSFKLYILLFLTTYLMTVISLLVSVMIKDEKLSDVLAIFGAFGCGITVVMIPLYFSVFNHLIIYLLFIGLVVSINYIVTLRIATFVKKPKYFI